MISKYIRLLRPIAWITFFFPFSVGFGLGITNYSNLYHVIFAFLAFIFWMGFSFVINAIADREVDKYHDGRSKDMNLSNQPLVTKEITYKKSIYLSILFISFSLFFAWLINPLFFLLILFVDVIGYIYSMPPLRLKTKPISDILCNASAAGIIFTAGLSIGGDNMNPIMILGGFMIAIVFYIPTVVTDYKFDKKAGLMTSAVFFGLKNILKSMYFLTVISIIIWLIVFLTSIFEIKILAVIVIIYIFIYTLVSNRKLKNDRLYLHENWILVPFTLFSFAFVVYGILKLIGWMIPGSI